MADPNNPSPHTVRLALAIPILQADLEDEEVEGSSPAPAGSEPPTDPYMALAAREKAWAMVAIWPDQDSVRIEFPYAETDALYELIETLYLIGGWAAVDKVCESTSITLVGAVSQILGVPRGENFAITWLLSDGLLRIPPEHLDLAKKAFLVLLARAADRSWPSVMTGLQAIVPFSGIFSYGPSHTGPYPSDVPNPEVIARLYANVVVNLEFVRRQLTTRIRNTLHRTEQNAKRLLSQSLLNSRADIIRETIRYFDFEQGSIDHVFKSTKRKWVKLSSEPGNMTRPAEQPAALQLALKKLVPFAQRINKLKGSARGAGTSTQKMVSEALQNARSIFAREMGRLAQEFPILSQIEENHIKDASEAYAPQLGSILFSILERANDANHETTLRLDGFGDLIITLTEGRHPEQDLAEAVQRLGKRNTIWGITKYVERAISQATSVTDEVAQKALADTVMLLGIESGETVKALAQGAIEMAALGMASNFATRFVPVLNIGLAAWHIGKSVKEFSEQEADFYCVLDPRDSLVSAAPSVAGLTIDIATEAVFAII